MHFTLVWRTLTNLTVAEYLVILISRELSSNFTLSSILVPTLKEVVLETILSLRLVEKAFMKLSW